MNSKVIFFSLIIVFLIYNLASFILRQRNLIKLNVNSLLKSLDFVPPTTKELQYEEGITRTTRARTTSTRFMSVHMPSVFCIIKTNPRSLASNKTLAVYKTWARKCDNYRFISLLETNSSLEKEEEIELREPFYILKPAGRYPENHDNMTEKVYAALKSIFMRFPDYDWYYLSDDDVYANMYNMKLFLRDKDLHKPVTYGFDFRKVVKGGYHSGGPGYILSREAFSRLGINLMQNRTQCPITGIDDVDIQSCLRELEVYPAPSLDHLKRERFIPLGLIAHFTGSVPQWFFEFSSNTFKKGYSCCSDRLIAVHYLKPEEIVRLDIAFETQTNVVFLYDKNANIRRHITFKDVFKMYILLGDFEMNTTSFKINFDDEETNKDSV